MTFDIYKDGQKINSIVANEDFVAGYCDKNGYTYKERETPAPVVEPEPTAEEILYAMLGVSRYE